VVRSNDDRRKTAGRHEEKRQILRPRLSGLSGIIDSPIKTGVFGYTIDFQ
jgi:hypothetical protein